MHIVLLNDDALPESQGGTAVVVDRLRSAYGRLGHRVTLLTTHQDPARGTLLRRDGVVSVLSSYPPGRRHRHCLGNPRMREALTLLLAELRPDAVHAHNVHAHLTYESLLLARRHTERLVLTAHDVFLVAFHRVRGRRFEELSLRGEPIRMHWWEHLASAGRKYWPPRNHVIKSILRSSGARIVAISEAHRRFLEANGIPVASVIYNGVEVTPPVPPGEVRAFRARHGLTGPTILFGGRLSDDKGASVLFQAFERVHDALPQAQILLVGHAERIGAILRTVPVQHRAAIVAAGWLGRDDMRIAYEASTLVTTPSLCFDPFNLMNAEAMAVGRPVVATRLGGAPEIVLDGETGSIVYPRDTEAYAGALLSLLRDPERARSMGERGRRRAEDVFTVERQARLYLDLLAPPHRSIYSR